jgi:hypothetical protein
MDYLTIRHPGQAHGTSITLAEWLCRTADRIDPASEGFDVHVATATASTAADDNIRSDWLQPNISGADLAI